jgi:hypothetical protein
VSTKPKGQRLVLHGTNIITMTAEVEASAPVMNTETENNEAGSESTDPKSQSALQENIERKGKHAYYFAHAHKANGPKWDGKIQPKLLSSSSNLGEPTSSTTSSFDYHKSNITSYAFSDEGKSVKLYIPFDGIGEKCSDEDITLESTEQSFCLVVRNYDEDQSRCLSFGKLTDRISSANYKLKKDKVIVVLNKETEKEWHTINDRGTPDHEVV